MNDRAARRDKAAVTEADLRAAAKLAGVAYTEAELSLMQGTIAEQIALANSRRAAGLPHDLPPASRFDPRLPGFTMPDPGPLAVPEDRRPLPEGDAAIAFAPVTALAHWIKSRQLSCRRLTEIYLSRIERHNSALLCYTLLSSTAREEADRLDAMLAAQKYLGPLHGIPYACKDIIDTAGIITDWGAEPYRGRTPETDAVVVTRLRAAGAVLLGKSTVGALAYGDLWYAGRTRNPWNPQEGSSGSSAGSASATAAGLCAFSLGTETLGSIVSPSTRCGTVGLRPTFGRVARAGAMALCPSLDKIGPICRGVDDTALVLAAINGADHADFASVSAPFGGDLKASAAGLRLGWFPADFKAEGATEADRATLAAAAALGAELIPLERPDLPYDALVSILMAEAAASFEPLTFSDRDDMLTWQDAEAWPNQFRAARFLSAVDHVQLDRLRRLVMQDMDANFERVDAIIGPSLAGPMLVITNFTGHPCLCLPDGFIESPTRGADTLQGTLPKPDDLPDDETHRVPRSIAIWGRLFDEATPLLVARALAQRLALDLRPPAFRE